MDLATISFVISLTIIHYLQDEREECQRLFEVLPTTLPAFQDCLEFQALVATLPTPFQQCYALTHIEPILGEGQQRRWKQVWRFLKSGINEKFGHIAHLELDTRVALQFGSISVTNAIRNDSSAAGNGVNHIELEAERIIMGQRAARINKIQLNFVSRADDEAYLELAYWISSGDFTSKRHAPYRKGTDGIGTWIMELQEWMRDQARTLCFGESILSSAAADHVQEHCKHDDDEIVLYFHHICKAQHDTPQLPAPLRRLASCCPLNYDTSNLSNDNQSHPFGAFTDGLKTWMITHSNVVVDALDETPKRGVTLATLRSKILSDSASFVVTLRQVLRDIYADLRKEGDIRSHAAQSSNGRVVVFKAKDKVVTEIGREEQTLFLLSRQCMVSLFTQAQPTATTELLAQYLNSVYDQVLEQINQHPHCCSQIAYNMLFWILYSFQPQPQCTGCATQKSLELAQDREDCFLSQADLAIGYIKHLFFEWPRLAYDVVHGGCNVPEFAGHVWVDHNCGLHHPDILNCTIKLLHDDAKVILSKNLMSWGKQHQMHCWHTSEIHQCPFLRLKYNDEYLIANKQRIGLQNLGGDNHVVLNMKVKKHMRTLPWAALDGYEGVMKASRVDVNLSDSECERILIYCAAPHKHVRMMRMLETGKANICAKDKKHNEPTEITHQDAIHSLNNLCQQRKLGFAEDLPKRTLDKYANMLGSHHITTLKTTNILGLTYNDQEKPKKQETIQNKALVEQQRALGSNYILFFDSILDAEQNEVNVADEDYDQIPHSWTAERNYNEMVNLLVVTNQVQVHVKKLYWRRFPSWAVESSLSRVLTHFNLQPADITSWDEEFNKILLHWAAMNGYTDVVRFLLKDQVDVNSRDKKYWRTPLSWTAENGFTEIAKLILKTDQVDIDLRDKEYGKTPFLWAAKTGKEEIIKLLLATGKIDVNTRDMRYGRTSLSWAAENGHKAVVELLLATDQVDINITDKPYGGTSLSWAAKHGHEEIVKLLLKTGWAEVDVIDNEDGKTPLFWAAEYGYEGVVKLLLATQRVDVNMKEKKYGRTPLSCAAENGHEAVVKLLLETDQVNIDVKDKECGQTPLCWAAEYGHEGVVKLLLETGQADLDTRDNKYGRTLLSWISEHGFAEMAKLLLETGKVKVNTRDKEYGRTPLIWAAVAGKERVIKVLLETGQVEVDARDKRCWRTALSWASEYGHEGVVRVLLDTGQVKVNARDKTYGQTPLSWAAQYGHEEIVRLLLATDQVEVNATDKQCGRTALSWAAGSGYEGVVKLLLQADQVEVDTQDKECSQTPLLWAAKNGHIGVVQLLQRGQAGVDVKDKRTSLLWASRNEHKKTS